MQTGCKDCLSAEQRLQIDNKGVLVINQGLLLNKKGWLSIKICLLINNKGLLIIKRRCWLSKQGVLFNHGGIKVNNTRCAGGFRGLQALFTSLSGDFTS